MLTPCRVCGERATFGFTWDVTGDGDVMRWTWCRRHVPDDVLREYLRAMADGRLGDG